MEYLSGLIRLSVGTEALADIIADLEQALVVLPRMTAHPKMITILGE